MSLQKKTTIHQYEYDTGGNVTKHTIVEITDNDAVNDGELLAAIERTRNGEGTPFEEGDSLDDVIGE